MGGGVLAMDGRKVRGFDVRGVPGFVYGSTLSVFGQGTKMLDILGGDFVFI